MDFGRTKREMEDPVIVLPVRLAGWFVQDGAFFAPKETRSKHVHQSSRSGSQLLERCHFPSLFDAKRC